MKSNRVNLSLNGEGTNVSGSELLAGQAQSDVLLLTADLLSRFGRGERQTSEGLLSSCACEVLVEDDGVLRPRPSRSPRTQ